MMHGGKLAFVIWIIAGVLFICLGIYDILSKKAKPFGFWANAETPPVKDAKAYNRALGKLWCGYGAIFILLGIPLLPGQSSAGVIITILGTLLEAIAAMVIYVTVIEPKHRKK